MEGPGVDGSHPFSCWHRCALSHADMLFLWDVNPLIGRCSVYTQSIALWCSDTSLHSHTISCMLDCLISCQHGAESIAHCRHCCTLMMPARTLTPSSLILHPERFSSAMVWLVRKPSLSTCSVSSVQPALLWQLTSIVYGRDGRQIQTCLGLPDTLSRETQFSIEDIMHTVHQSHHRTQVLKKGLPASPGSAGALFGGSTVEPSTPDRKVACSNHVRVILLVLLALTQVHNTGCLH